MNHTQRAIFAGGCFWCTYAAFAGREGVCAVVSGYTGGDLPNPTYEQVCGGRTGHTEAVEVTFDPVAISYTELLGIFWRTIDPADAGGQFFDRGSQYRTAIFYLDENQRGEAEASKQAVEARLGAKVATEVLPAVPFYPAEAYHQDYHRTNPAHYNAYKQGSGRERRLKEMWEE